jgi:molecular chaperone GrpE (heat shock protein)
MDEQSDFTVDRWLDAFKNNDALYHKKQEMRQMILTLLDVLASFDRCFAAIMQQETLFSRNQRWLLSFAGVRNQLLVALEQAGVHFMNCTGSLFDTAKHEVVEVRLAVDKEENSILEEIVRGCEWDGEVLCYAQVVVATHSVNTTSRQNTQRER